MKSVMLSIQPKWCELIASGKKTIEVRKSAPKLGIPFKCYIYCTKDKYQHLYDLRPYTNSEISLSLTQHNKTSLVPQNYWNGKVIGEFVCDRIEMVNASCSDYGIDLFYHDCKVQGCLTEKEVEKYFNIPEDKDLRVMKGNGYAWHISDLVIYDQPKELSEFYRECPQAYSSYEDGCCAEMCVFYEEGYCKQFCLPITKAPQSWRYCEELEK